MSKKKDTEDIIFKKSPLELLKDIKFDIPKPKPYEDLENRKKEPGYKKQASIILNLMKPYGLIDLESDIVAMHYFGEPTPSDTFGGGGKMYQYDFKDCHRSYVISVRIRWDDIKVTELKEFIEDNSSLIFESVNFGNDNLPIIYKDSRDELTIKFYFKWIQRKLKIDAI